MPRHVDTPASQEHAEGFALQVVLPPEQFEALAQRVADVLEERRDDGFLNVEGAAEYLATTTPKAIYHLVERRKLPHRRAGGRLLFDRAELRAWVEGGG